MSPQALARVVAAAHAYCNARDRYMEEQHGTGWMENRVALDAAYAELRASCGFEVEQ